jgi:hypothetical protein
MGKTRVEHCPTGAHTFVLAFSGDSGVATVWPDISLSRVRRAVTPEIGKY